jgi:hypothetical protein
MGERKEGGGWGRVGVLKTKCAGWAVRPGQALCLCWWLLTFVQEVGERFPWAAEAEAILPVQVFRWYFVFLPMALLRSHFLSLAVVQEHNSGSSFCHWSSQDYAFSSFFLYLSQLLHMWLTYHLDEGLTKFLWNSGQYLPDYTVQHPRGHPSSW